MESPIEKASSSRDEALLSRRNLISFVGAVCCSSPFLPSSVLVSLYAPSLSISGMALCSLSILVSLVWLFFSSLFRFFWYGSMLPLSVLFFFFSLLLWLLVFFGDYGYV